MKEKVYLIRNEHGFAIEYRGERVKLEADDGYLKVEEMAEILAKMLGATLVIR